MSGARGATPPIRFCFGVHLHQPVGNFDSVFEQHMAEVYLPFLTHARDAGFLPVTLHISGPLLEWMEAHDTRYLDLVGRLAADGQVELLLSGMYEPVLVSLPREDRLEQIRWMRDALRRRFGVDARGLWLTERVWESELAADLHDAGVRYALVDDRHFVVSGFDRERLHAPFRTEGGGKRVALFPIDERLRYLIPFQPPSSTVEYLRALRAAGQPLAVLADDGEKFGGWPGTLEWVYAKGWLDRFFVAIGEAVASGDVVLSTFADALETVPSGGLAYLGTASYREMEAWSLPPERAHRLEMLERDVGAERVAGPDGALIRGAHWRNFFVKYPEANRMHKKMLALSARCRQVGDPADARRAIARAQCNDAYWHGVFGGLYLPHLRDAIWRNLAHAERVLRRGAALDFEVVDMDGDGHDEVWVHSATFSAVVSPRRGGAIEEWTVFERGINYANTLTRRREAYHKIDPAAAHAVSAAEAHGDATPSIHDVEARVRLSALPPADADDRAILVDRVLGKDVSMDDVVAARYAAEHAWSRVPLSLDVVRTAHDVTITMTDAAGLLAKALTFTADGTVRAAWTWAGTLGPADGHFVTELSVAGAVDVECPAGSIEWTYDIETVAMSERGLDRTRQGTALLRGWPVDARRAALVVRPAAAASER